MTWPILFTVHQLKWVCGPNVGGNGSKNNSQPKKKKNRLYKETNLDKLHPWGIFCSGLDLISTFAVQ